MKNTIVPEGHVFIDTAKYRRFLYNDCSVKSERHLVRIQTKEMWDRQIKRENEKMINNAIPKPKKQVKNKKESYKKRRNKLLESESWRKERYHKSVWKNTDSGKVTKAGPVTVTKRNEN